MSLEELKYVLGKMYGFDITKKTRAREKVYAKKVFITLANNYGYQWKDITPVIKMKHDICIYHKKTFGTINPRDLHHYNKCIEFFNLPMDMIPSVNAIDGNILVDEIALKLSGLGRRDVRFFYDKVFRPFERKLELEKSMVDPSYTGKRVEN